MSEVFVPNSKSGVHFILVDFGGGCSCSSCDRFKTKSTPLSSWTGVWQKKLCLNKKFVEKNVGTRKILLVIKNLWTQNSFIQKKFGSTKFWVRRYFKSKKIELKKRLCLKKLMPKKICSKKICVQTKIWVQKFCVHKIFGPKKFYGPKNFGQTKFFQKDFYQKIEASKSCIPNVWSKLGQ